MIIPFEPEHAQAIVADNLRKQEGWFATIDVTEWLKTCKDNGAGYTLMVDNCPIACAGIIFQGWHKAAAWALLSSLFYRHKVKIHRAIKSGLDATIIENKLRRVEALIDPRFPQSIDFIECFGFMYEGCLRKWGPNSEDFLMYARTN